jgi:hypothetical protein
VTASPSPERERLALPEHVRSHEDLPEAAWAKYDEIWQSQDYFDTKRLVQEFADILRAEATEHIARLLRAPVDRERHPALTCGDCGAQMMHVCLDCHTCGQAR